MSVLKIVKYGDPVLRKKAQIVTEITDDVKRLVKDMFDTMYASKGVGLAAPQVGISLQICVVDVLPDGKNRPFVLINPKIISGEDKIEQEEGCLSFPKIYEKVRRYNKINIEYTEISGGVNTAEVEGFLAKAFQHETDHLNGKVFIDYLPDWKRKLVEKEVRRRKKAKNW